MSLRRIFLVGWMGTFNAAAASAESPAPLDRLILQGGTACGPIRLIGHDAHQQLLVTAQLHSGELRDCTRTAHYSAEPAGIVQISPTGDVTPQRDGTATITVADDGKTTTLSVTVERCGESLPINFANQIV